MPGLEPEVHVACTLMGEDISVSQQTIAGMLDEKGGKRGH
jgi:hypothetical protein